ncbi:MAG: hypothetical protein M3O46_13440 [Myxococcota bacterium]|nr:hypothetical protein [Myxococcota bacterium]
MNVEVLSGLPAFSGLDVIEYAVSRSKQALRMMMATQLWPFPAFLPAMLVREPPPIPLDPRGAHAQLQRQGVTIGVLEATSMDAPGHALGIALPESARRAIDRYATPRSAFVLLRIDDPALVRAQSQGLGISVVFPATTGYFPLVASAGLSEEPFDLSVTALDFVKSAGAPHPGLRTSFLLRGYEWDASRDRSAQPAYESNRFTRFELVATPSALTDDLTLFPRLPSASRWLRIFSSAAPALGSASAWHCSSFAPWLPWLRCRRGCWPREVRPKKRTVAALGLLNVATVMAPLVASLLLARRLGVSPNRAVIFVAVSSVVLTISIAVLLIAMKRLAT